ESQRHEVFSAAAELPDSPYSLSYRTLYAFRAGAADHRAPVVTPSYVCGNGGRIILAGVSRSTTVAVAYLMTVTTFGWEDCLDAVKAVRSYADPNLGFQQQLQEYEVTLVKEYRSWLRQEYGRDPLNDQDRVEKLLSERAQAASPRETQDRWVNQPHAGYILPYKAYGGSK
ncbi:PREDICTED: dual specificity protein phosphatase 22-A-like, partial [Nanorana parkeri]|uniref:dual specificity protein phosphatase 22-A-like n=1 Tax=Nanorana parkeri TaxID=125878 RepID=UPI00085421C3